MATKSERASTAGAKSQMSDARRERLLDIQKREQLKGLLSNKFKLKYGDKPNIATYIDNEVGKFLKNDRLTEDNLKNLDLKIMKECNLRDKKDAILDDKRSEKSAGGRPRATSQRPGTGAAPKQGVDLETRSVASSRMSGASHLSKTSKNKDKRPAQDFDRMSMASSQAAMTEVYSELNEDDEWTAIQKFNTLLHYEEQKQSIMRDRERKRLIKEELDK